MRRIAKFRLRRDEREEILVRNKRQKMQTMQMKRGNVRTRDR